MIAFNLQPLAEERLTGIGFYASNVMKGLRREIKTPCEFHVFDFMSRNKGASMAASHLEDCGITEGDITTVTSIPLSVYIRMGKAGRIRPYEKITSSKADLTVFFNYLAPAGVTGKRIITIYDMVCERFPETMQGKNRRLLRRHLAASAQNADAVVTISEFSKKEIHGILGIPEEKIFVAHCGTDTSFYRPASDEEERSADKKTSDELTGGGRYILYVGTLEPRKNIKTLVKAFGILGSKAGMEDVRLVLAGGLGWQSASTLEAIGSSPLKDRIIRTGYISQEQKRALFRNASLFCFPSLYEGFGMPVTEAMACGTTCVISDTSSLPEVAGGKAFTAPALDDEAYAGIFEEILSGAAKVPSRDELIAQASSFTWEKAADVYMEAIASCGVDLNKSSNMLQ
ncbi:MAG: glycosyltransferase family 4 protein [Clostridiales bacterium]|nr:glycosyltransferase family 4 protein [Clostridiales bacterium]